VAVFDADGTLWRGDVGEDLLRYLAAHRHLVGSNEGVFARYQQLNEVNPVESYAFAVEVMAGLDATHLSRLCDDFFAQRFLGRVFSWVRPTLEVLAQAQVQLWVCSASPRWAVEPGASALGIPGHQVIGVEAELRDGRLSPVVLRPISAGTGKVHWLTVRGVTPGLCVGNGDLDLDMLEHAPHRLVVAPFDGPENHLVAQARVRGWPILKT